jgi:dihydroflavonol-4-reductase
MRVLVTGGTGFVGSHTVAALLAAGHDVRLLVRDAARISPALTPLGVADSGAVEHVVGDIADERSVATALAGCDSVLHAAGVYSFDSRQHKRIRDVNVSATAVVLRAATDAGCDPIVYVSSTLAVLPRIRGTMITAVSPTTRGKPPGAYIRSKAEAEVVARRSQDDGAPIVITYPGAVHGPHDPYLGESAHRISVVLRRGMPVAPSGGYHLSDVRDVAQLHAATIVPGLGPRRYVAPGHYSEIAGEVRTIARLTGRRLPVLAVPARAMIPALRVGQLVQRPFRSHYPADAEAAWVCDRAAPADWTPAAQLLGIAPRPYEETLADEVRWLAASGHIRARLAGKLSSPADDE